MTKLGHKNQHEVVEVGAKATIYAIKLSDGTCPVTDWLATLNDRKYSAATARMRSLAERGWLRSPDAFRNLAVADGRKVRVDEIKHVGADLRIYVADFSTGDTEIYVTHATSKPKKSKVAQEVDRARTIYKEK